MMSVRAQEPREADHGAFVERRGKVMSGPAAATRAGEAPAAGPGAPAGGPQSASASPDAAQAASTAAAAAPAPAGTAQPLPPWAAAHAGPPDRQLLRARLFLRAALPVARIIVEDDPAMRKRFNGVHAVVQFVVKDRAGVADVPGEPDPLAAHIVFDDDVVRVEPGRYDHAAGRRAAKPDITFSFASAAKLNDFFAGKTVLPGIKGFTKPGLLIKVLQLLLALKLMLPSAQPKDPDKRRLKVKMTLYMITTALSQYNKGGDPQMVRWTSRQPDRIYQMSVEPEGIAAYLRVRAGQSKAGRGFYERRRPFVHLRFHGVDGALAVMNKEVGFVEGVSKGLVRIDGSPEYAADLNDFMQRVQALLVG
jgi:hypothetical protein